MLAGSPFPQPAKPWASASRFDGLIVLNVTLVGRPRSLPKPGRLSTGIGLEVVAAILERGPAKVLSEYVDRDISSLRIEN
jgi:hypothetical protein